MDNTLPYIVQRNTRESPDTVTLSLAATDGSIPSFTPGQFISIYFPELNTPEGKSYSISNAPGKGTLDITVKAIGEFSSRLCALKQGETVTGSLPYGFFFSEQKGTSLIMIAGGIGVTPFRAIIADAQTTTPKRSLSLFHSARNVNDLLFAQEFSHTKNLATHYFVTREAISRDAAIARRICSDDILANCAPEQSEFFICGSIPFVRDLWRSLREAGISEEKIYTEAFFSH